MWRACALGDLGGGEAAVERRERSCEPSGALQMAAPDEAGAAADQGARETQEVASAKAEGAAGPSSTDRHWARLRGRYNRGSLERAFIAK